MERTEISELIKDYKNYIGKEVKINGWIRTIRDSKTFGFIELNDGSSFKGVQIVIDDTLENFKDIIKYTIYSSIEVYGEVVESQGAKQAFEIKASKIIL